MQLALGRSRLLAMFVALMLPLGLAAAPASAQQQRGLVNVFVADNTIQVPIAVAANICGLQVAVLAQRLRQGPTDCEAVAPATATRQTGGGGGGGARQRGLVNIFIADNVVQVPVGIAANLCNTQAAVLAQQVRQGTAECTAEANPQANA